MEREEREGVERVMGIEPTLEAWEASVLPLNYTRDLGWEYKKPRTALASAATLWLSSPLHSGLRSDRGGMARRLTSK